MEQLAHGFFGSLALFVLLMGFDWLLPLLLKQNPRPGVAPILKNEPKRFYSIYSAHRPRRFYVALILVIVDYLIFRFANDFVWNISILPMCGIFFILLGYHIWCAEKGVVPRV